MEQIPDVSLDRVLGRVRECGECLEWAGYAIEGRFPQIRLNWKLYPVRRVVWTLSRGPIKSDVWVGTKCENPLCVNPDHLVIRSRSKALKGVTRTVAHKQKIALSRRKGSKITDQIARDIRSSNDSNLALAERYGVHHSLISNIRLGKAWREYVTPFAGLGKR